METMYRGVIKASIDDIKLGIPVDKFFLTKQEATIWVEQCQVYLEKAKVGAFNLLIKDSNNRLVKRLRQKDSWLLESNSIDPNTRKESSNLTFKAIFEQFGDSTNLISLNVDSVSVESFEFREESLTLL